MNLKSFVFQAVWILLILPSFSAENLCKSELLISSNISAELQSDVLLPCNFNPALLGSDKTADIAVVWSQRNTTIHNLVEITLQGVAKFWNYKGGRIKTFPKLSESGNFSILLQKVQPYDLSLYHCELFNGTNCRIAYQELQLQLRWTDENILVAKWLFIAGGGAAFLTLLVVLICFIKCAHSNASNNRIYANTRFEKRNNKECSEEKHSSNQHAATAKNKVYDNKPQNHSNIYGNICVQAGEIYTNQLH
ncbi:uncharacterized protein LOC113531562 isoform X4 [Pangasianodon hypophthalmus]|uniref:uncharacterized protein LOC113531562 isoform X4 n=1 Tax=Pangasianodon hypophthalmus TaxID=310915 RepID=UPI00230783BF|nr:uncharacterized protein LOC113531562 isoform X4 [Pangasianodon hypophthalmus]